jgi:RNA polymerase sigma-70 factor (ECF subfamily)
MAQGCGVPEWGITMPYESSRVRSVSSMGELTALGQLFQEHRGRLLGLIRRRMSPALAHRVEAEDILNDVYLKLHQRWLEQPGSHKPSPHLLYQTAKDCLIDAWRRHKRQNRDLEREEPWPERASQVLGSKLASSLTTPTEALRRKELAEHIQAALEELDRIDREILEFRYLDRMTYAEIAEMLEISRDAAMQRHARALRRIKLDDPRFEE